MESRFNADWRKQSQESQLSCICLLGGYRFWHFLWFFYWIFELFRQCVILFLVFILLHKIVLIDERCFKDYLSGVAILISDFINYNVIILWQTDFVWLHFRDRCHSSCNNVAPVTNVCIGRATTRSHSSQWSKKKSCSWNINTHYLRFKHFIITITDDQSPS
jgi:hypothetical protein